MTYRQNEADNAQTKQTSTHLGDSAIVNLKKQSELHLSQKNNTHSYLLAETQTSQQEAHTENKEQIGQDGSQKGCLDNADLILLDVVSCFNLQKMMGGDR